MSFSVGLVKVTIYNAFYKSLDLPSLHNQSELFRIFCIDTDVLPEIHLFFLSD